MPVIPPTPWTPNTSSESSYLKRCFSQVQAQKHMEPAITPMTMPCHGATKPLAGVIVPRPAPAPEIMPSHHGLRRIVHSIAPQVRAPAAQPAWPHETIVPYGIPQPDKIVLESHAQRRCWMRRSYENLQRVAVGFAGPDPQRVIDRRHKNLAVTDLAGARARGDDVHRLVGKIRRDGNFDSELRQKIHDIFGAAIDLGVALLAAVALDLGDGHAGDPDRGECLAHLVKFEWFDNGNNELHGQAFFSEFSAAPVRALICLHASLASFCANGTKSLQPDRKTIAVVRPRSLASPQGQRHDPATCGSLPAVVLAHPLQPLRG